MPHILDAPTDRFAAVPPPTRPVPPPGSRPPRRFLRTLGAAAVALAVAGGVAGVLEGLGSAGPENRYQPVSYAGDNPFASPVGTDRPGVAPVAGAGGEQDGDTPEMYAADPAAPACDAGMLLAELQADPARAAVWAQVQRVTPDQVPAFVQGLSPVVLRTETAVVDHGYRDGRSVATPSVLAAGTAVFVNSYGQPVVKCFSGNPLTPGASTDPAVTRVRPAAAPIATYAFHDPASRGPLAQPGRPDTTGSGPVPIPVEPDAGSGGTPIPVEQDGGPGGTPGTPTTPTTPPLTGTFNWDGSVTLSDGRVQTVDGRILTLPPLPAGAVPLPDGGYREADGTYRNRDGSRREEVRLSEQGGALVVLAPDGTLLDAGGSPLGERELEGVTVVRGHDGFVTVITDNPRGDDTVVVYHPQGKPINIVTGTVTGGVIRDAAGQVRNPDGTVRRETTLPDGGTVLPDGTHVPAPSTGHGGGTPQHPQGGGTPTPTVPIDPPFEPRPTGGTTVPPIDPPVEPREDRGERDGGAASSSAGGGSGSTSGSGGTSAADGEG
ncbi:DUF6777 domain-containing protein [Actinomycetospora rhizophila]|uniref:DUF6777 domain-containing protein n=1 Tax=Actinomycetospora rhizophila TaxID=1416876 RepID=A0ABV9ZFR8_9PSEU